jgi:type I restriction-modification system DNA methylase subunit
MNEEAGDENNQMGIGDETGDDNQTGDENNQMGGVIKPEIYKMSMDDIIHKINENLPINKEKKEQHGEVFTPYFLIKEMLERLPSNVWKNPHLKWLEPANGFGGFAMVIYALLMDRLPDKYNSKKTAYSTKYGKSQHILKKMLYMAEIDADNIAISRKMFGRNANIYHADFLDDNTMKGMQFDIIVGNPHYT